MGRVERLMDDATGTEPYDIDELEETVRELAPSATLVYKVLEYNNATYAGPQMTQQNLQDETLLSERTLRSALNELEEHDIVTADTYIGDARKKLYGLNVNTDTFDDMEIQ